MPEAHTIAPDHPDHLLPWTLRRAVGRLVVVAIPSTLPSVPLRLPAAPPSSHRDTAHSLDSRTRRAHSTPLPIVHNTISSPFPSRSFPSSPPNTRSPRGHPQTLARTGMNRWGCGGTYAPKLGVALPPVSNLAWRLRLASAAVATATSAPTDTFTPCIGPQPQPFSPHRPCTGPALSPTHTPRRVPSQTQRMVAATRSRHGRRRPSFPQCSENRGPT